MGTFSGMLSIFSVEDWNIPLCLYGPKWDKRMALPPEISLLLPQHGIVSGQQGASELVYTNIGEVRRTWLLFYYGRRASVFY